MANSYVRIAVDCRDTPDLKNPATPAAGKEIIKRLRNYLSGIMSGAQRAHYCQVDHDTGVPPVQASGTVNFSSTASDDTITINGVAFTASNTDQSLPANTFYQGGTDTQDATAFVVALNASTTALVTKLVQGCNLVGTITLASAVAGTTIDLGTVRLIAVAGSGAAILGEAGGEARDRFNIDTSDTAAGTSLAAVINAHPILNKQVVASSAAGVVTLRQLSGTTAAFTMLSPFATVTIAQLAAAAKALVSAIEWGYMGNCVTLASSSGSHNAVSGARFTGGTGGGVSTVTTYTFKPNGVA